MCAGFVSCGASRSEIIHKSPVPPQKVQGPEDPGGQGACRFNAARHGINSEHLLPGESAAEFELLVRDSFRRFRPVGAMEEFMARRIAMCFWRMKRIERAESEGYHAFLGMWKQVGATMGGWPAEASGTEVGRAFNSLDAAKIARYERAVERCMKNAKEELSAMQAARMSRVMEGDWEEDEAISGLEARVEEEAETRAVQKQEAARRMAEDEAEDESEELAAEQESRQEEGEEKAGEESETGAGEGHSGEWRNGPKIASTSSMDMYNQYRQGS